MNENKNECTNEELVDETVVVSKNKTNPASNLIDYIEIIVVAIFAVMLLFTIFTRTCTVDGDSMNNTLHNTELLLISDAFYTPQRQDVIVFHNNDGTSEGKNNKPLVKRVIGIAGDTVVIDNNAQTVTVTSKDGETQVLEEEYVFFDPYKIDSFNGVQTYVVPEGKLFVLGDNRRASLDSRYSTIGYVDERSVLGKVYLRISPMSKIGIIK